MIYADTSFLFSLYAWDGNTDEAAETYLEDRRRPLLFTPWQRFELRNAIRLAVHRLQRAGQAVPFQPGNIFKRMEADLSAGRLVHAAPDDLQVLRLSEELSADHTAETGAGAVDVWHVAAAILLQADTFWTFDEDQWALAKARAAFRKLPELG